MKILVISQERRYERIVNELRKDHEVDYLFRSNKWLVDRGDYHIPRAFGLNRAFKFLARVTSGLLLVTRRYDVCIVDYRSLSIPTIFPALKEYLGLLPTSFVYDIRTIPVDHLDSEVEKVERRFCRNLRLADRCYQGITVITDEMKSYIENKYLSFKKPVGIWESGVDSFKFRPAEKNLALKKSLGFHEDDFICFYHGSISRKRGVEEVVEAFEILKRKKGSIKFFLLGNGSSCSGIEQKIKDAGLHDSVKMHDWVEYGQVQEYISVADLCIVPLPDIEWWRVSSPFKLMEYIACGKNILLTDMAAHTGVVGKSADYFWVQDATAESFARKIEEAYGAWQEAPDAFRQKGMAARERFIDRICWECRARSLQEFLAQVAGARH